MTKKRVLELQEEGMSYKAIADKIGLFKASVENIVQKGTSQYQGYSLVEKAPVQEKFG